MFRYRLEFKGRLYVKKNSKRIVFNKKTGRPFIISSPQYLKHEKQVVGELQKQFIDQGGKTIQEPVCIIYKFRIKGKVKVDSNNLVGSIDDIIEKAEIIKDDVLIEKRIVIDQRGASEWGVELNILNAKKCEKRIRNFIENMLK